MVLLLSPLVLICLRKGVYRVSEGGANTTAAGCSTERDNETCQKRLGLYLFLQNKSLHSQQRQLRTFRTLKSIFRLLEIGGRHPGDANLLPLQTSWHAHTQIHTQITTKHVTSRSVPAHPQQNHCDISSVRCAARARLTGLPARVLKTILL